MTAAEVRCGWCGKYGRKVSNWEQQTTAGEWRTLCTRCANSRLGNPFNGLLTMRKIGDRA